MIELPVDLPAELAPLAWLIGEWSGTGVLDYPVGDEHVQHEFAQRVAFAPGQGPYLRYEATSRILGDDGPPLAEETGYWRLSRPRGEGDAGPGMLPPRGDERFTTAEQVESLRGEDESFGLEATILHPDGAAELYLGTVAGPRIDLATDAVLRTPGARDFSAATRLYGLVDGHLLWAWDIAALGQELRSHASARLAKVGAGREE